MCLWLFLNAVYRCKVDFVKFTLYKIKTYMCRWIFESYVSFLLQSADLSLVGTMA